MVSKARRNSSLPRELSLVLSRHSHAKRCQKLCVGKGEKSTHAPFYEKSIGFRFDHKSHSFLAPSTRTIEPSVRDPTLVGGGRLRIFLASIAKTATRLTSLCLLGRGDGGGATAVRGGPTDKTGKSKTPPSEALAESPLLLPCVRSRYQPRGSPRTRQLSGPYYVCKKARSLTKSFFDGRTW